MQEHVCGKQIVHVIGRTARDDHCSAIIDMVFHVIEYCYPVHETSVHPPPGFVDLLQITTAAAPAHTITPITRPYRIN
jgi:hypothetical protein